MREQLPCSVGGTVLTCLKQTPEVTHDDNTSTHIQLIVFCLFPVSLPTLLLELSVTSQINYLH